MSDTTVWTGTLTDAQREQFVREGYLYLKNVFDGEDSKQWVRDECGAVGYDVDDPTTWEKPYLRLPTQRKVSLPTYAPALYAASCALLGGEERLQYRPGISLFALNFAEGADRPFEPASPDTRGWHKDGWHFIHFLDSPEQGLLGIPLLTDVLPHGGATFIAVGSVAKVAQYLASRPEGVGPNDFPVRELLQGCEFWEATGSAGDVYLCHPYLLHAVSQNVLKRTRAINNTLYQLKEPMQFDRADGNYSPVEAAVLYGLGVDRFPFHVTGTRYVTPDGGPIHR